LSKAPFSGPNGSCNIFSKEYYINKRRNCDTQDGINLRINRSKGAGVGCGDQPPVGEEERSIRRSTLESSGSQDRDRKKKSKGIAILRTGLT